MIYDIHAHVAGLTPASRKLLSRPLARQSLMLRYFVRGLERKSIPGPEARPVGDVASMFLEFVDQSRVDRIVVLALDGAYRADGSLDLENTALMVDNADVASLVSRSKKLLFGASIHPSRRDALTELDKIVKLGACLVKWIPSAQNIQPDDPSCFPFYEALAHYKLPLLVHIGNEHTVRQYSNALNDPKRMIPALVRGVTVICAHCGTRLFLHEKSFFQDWKTLALKYEGFFGDLSAFSLPLHGRPLNEILHSRELVSKVVYGSDFPVFPMPTWYVSRIGLRTVCRLRGIKNPFDSSYYTLKHMGVPDEVFERGGQLLRLPVEIGMDK